MAKKQTRRSISVSRLAYERLKAFCETSGISMSQFVETGINEKLDDAGAAPSTSLPTAMVTMVPTSPRPTVPATPRPSMASTPVAPRPVAAAAPAPTPMRSAPTPMTSAAARYAVEPPPPIIKPRTTEQQPKAPAEPTPGQIFTF